MPLAGQCSDLTTKLLTGGAMALNGLTPTAATHGFMMGTLGTQEHIPDTALIRRGDTYGRKVD